MSSGSLTMEKFFRRRTVPLLTEDENRSYIQGTGAIFRFGDKAYYVTARHVFDGVDFSKVGIPIAPDRDALHVVYEKDGQYARFVDSSVLTFREAEIHAPKDGKHDLAMVELKDQELVRELERQWLFLSVADMLGSLKGVEDLWVAGFPNGLVEFRQDREFFPLFTLCTQSDPSAAKGCELLRPIDLTVDLVLRYGRQLYTADGELRDAPHLAGISGCLVWGVTGDPEKVLEKPERHLKVAGVECSFRRSRFIRAHKLNVLGGMLQKADPDAWVEMAELYGWAR